MALQAVLQVAAGRFLFRTIRDAALFVATEANSLAQQLAHVTAEQLSARLLRIERSVLRQERVSLEILVNMQKLVAASRRPRPDSAVD